MIPSSRAYETSAQWPQRVRYLLLLPNRQTSSSAWYSPWWVVTWWVGTNGDGDIKLKDMSVFKDLMQQFFTISIHFSCMIWDFLMVSNYHFVETEFAGSHVHRKLRGSFQFATLNISVATRPMKSWFGQYIRDSHYWVYYDSYCIW